MSEIKSVAIAGASGTLGSHVLKALVNANFQVTVLTRHRKEGAYDTNVRVLEVDYTSVDSLATALKGVDAVISTVTPTAMGDQHILIDATIAAGVKRFFPSEYGSCTTSPKVQALPLYAPMAKTRTYLQEKAQSGHLTWTVLACGAFLDFILASPAFIDFANHKATLLDGGNNRVSSTSLLNIGKAIAASLKNPDATKNRVVHISEVIITQNKILSIAKEAKPEIKWEISKAQSKELLKESLEQLSVVGFEFPTIVPIILKLVTATAFGGDEYGSAYDVTDNDLLGIEELTEEELKKLVAGKLA